MDRDETADLAAFFEAINHVVQWRIRQSIAIVREKDLFILDEMSDCQQSCPDVTPSSRVNKCNAPIWWTFTQYFNLLAEIRYDTIAVRRLFVVQEIILDDVRLVPEAKDEIVMTVLAVVLHDMPQDRLMANRHHRLGNGLGVFANTRAQPPTEQDHFHD